MRVGLEPAWMSLSTVARRAGDTDAISRTTRSHASGHDSGRARGGGPPPLADAPRSSPSLTVSPRRDQGCGIWLASASTASMWGRRVYGAGGVVGVVDPA